MSRPSRLKAWLRVVAGGCAIVFLGCWWAIIDGGGVGWGVLSLVMLFSAGVLLAASVHRDEKRVASAGIRFACHALGLLVCPLLLLPIVAWTLHPTVHDVYHVWLLVSTIGTTTSQIWIGRVVVPRVIRQCRKRGAAAGYTRGA
jgi:peptidoglycan/LPS O-acetylase OafA/YrhL